MDPTPPTSPTEQPPKAPKHPRVRQYTAAQRAGASKRASVRRDLLRKLAICINGSLPAELARFYQRRSRLEHGAPVAGKGGRCQRCADIHAKSRDRPIDAEPIARVIEPPSIRALRQWPAAISVPIAARRTVTTATATADAPPVVAVTATFQLAEVA